MNINEFKFNTFLKRWNDEIRGKTSSNPGDYYTPAYNDIMGMKHEALPFILQQLIKEGDNPNDWFYALVMITHVNPVPRELRGNRCEMAKKWIAWGHEKGLIQSNKALESLREEMKKMFMLVEKPVKKNEKRKANNGNTKPPKKSRKP